MVERELYALLQLLLFLFVAVSSFMLTTGQSTHPVPLLKTQGNLLLCIELCTCRCYRCWTKRLHIVHLAEQKWQSLVYGTLGNMKSGFHSSLATKTPTSHCRQMHKQCWPDYLEDIAQPTVVSSWPRLFLSSQHERLPEGRFAGSWNWYA